ncbi:MAG: 50S ribosomal protein L5 [Alphaproteobacteria bacterium]
MASDQDKKNKQQGDQPAAKAEAPKGEKAEGAKPEGSKPEGSKPEGSKPEGSKPEGSRPAKGGGAPKGGGGKKGKHAEVAEDTGPRQPARMRIAYGEKVRPAIAEKFGIKNPMAMPRLEKIVINVNMGRHIEGSKIPPEKKNTVLETIQKVTGQKPVVVKAKKSVSNFKVREGFDTAAMVTLRRERMWHFLDRLINLATPRIKDFRGLSRKAFDRQGNYAMGITEQGVFPEINMAEVNFTHGMNINFCFKNSNADKSFFVLEQLGFPFAKPEERRPPRQTAATAAAAAAATAPAAPAAS